MGLRGTSVIDLHWSPHRGKLVSSTVRTMMRHSSLPRLAGLYGSSVRSVWPRGEQCAGLYILDCTTCTIQYIQHDAEVEWVSSTTSILWSCSPAAAGSHPIAAKLAPFSIYN